MPQEKNIPDVFPSNELETWKHIKTDQKHVNHAQKGLTFIASMNHKFIFAMK